MQELEAGVEQQRGAQPLPFLGMDKLGAAACTFSHRGLCTKGECRHKDCPFLHVDASTVGCPWYDRGFCRQGPRCRYKHTRRVMCANYLVGFCPEGPNCTFMHVKAGLMTSSTDPSKGAGCPRGLVQLDLAASKETGCKDVLPTEPPLPATGATQHPAVQPWDTNSSSPDTQTLSEQGTG